MQSHPVTLGEKGRPVQTLQYRLRHNRWGKDFYAGPLDGEFGPLTMTAVREARYWLGYPDAAIPAHTVGDELRSYLRPLNEDGKRLGAKMVARRAKRRAQHAVKPRRLKRFAIAQRQVGYQERAGNHTKFGAWYGMDGVSWCAIFVSWCDHQAGGDFKYAYTPYISRDARAHANGLQATGNPKRGHGVTFDWEGGHSTEGTDHVGIFNHWIDRRAGIFATVEGNTGTVNQSDGDGVWNKVRYTSLVACFFIIRKAA